MKLSFHLFLIYQALIINNIKMVDIREKLDALYSIKSVRETNAHTKNLLERNELTNFNIDKSKLDSTAEFVIQTIRESFPTNETLLSIPIHGRYQQFESDGKERLTNIIETEFKNLNDLEICKKLVDLFMVSVLLDAGAGNVWKYKEVDGTTQSRSEGLAVASLHMFADGLFSDDKKDPFVVNGSRLSSLTEKKLQDGLQVTSANPISGFEGRFELLHKLGDTLSANKALFGTDGRPGNLIDYLLNNKLLEEPKDGKYKIDLQDLWLCLVKGLQPIWPTEGRVQICGEYIGDVWFLQSRKKLAQQKFGTPNPPEWTYAVTFHKLLQWLTYSLMLPLKKYGHFEITHCEYMTGLPEYRNGGLFVDSGVLTLKPEQKEKGLALSVKLKTNVSIPTYVPDDDVIVEWRSCTICLLDELLVLVNHKLQITGTKYELTLPQLIEAGSWKSGRRIAKQFRKNGGPPIELHADGTVF